MVWQLGILFDLESRHHDRGLHRREEHPDLRIPNVLFGRQRSIDRRGVRWADRNVSIAIRGSFIVRTPGRSRADWLGDKLVHIVRPLSAYSRVHRGLWLLVYVAIKHVVVSP